MKHVIIKLLKAAEASQLWHKKMESVGVEIDSPLDDHGYLDFALDLMRVPEENWTAVTEDQITPDQFCRVCLMQKFWDDVDDGTFNPKKYMDWVYSEMHQNHPPPVETTSDL